MRYCVQPGTVLLKFPPTTKDKAVGRDAMSSSKQIEAKGGALSVARYPVVRWSAPQA